MKILPLVILTKTALGLLPANTMGEEDDTDCDYEVGFDPYEGCYTYDC